MAGNITVAAAIFMLLTGVQAQQSVTLYSQNLCAVTGSIVKIPCRFLKPNAKQKEWSRVQSSEKEPLVLSKDPQYSRRVSVSTQEFDCELTISNVSVNDSGVYNFRFKPQRSVWISAPSGVYLTVTDLQVKVDPDSLERTEVEVICNSTCTLSTSRFIWYRDDKLLKKTHNASILLDPIRPSNEGSYSCQVTESSHRSPPTCVLGKECWGVTYTRDHVCALKGTSIDLSCSYKHPAGHTVTKSGWFIKKQADDEPVDMRGNEEYQGRVQYTQNSQNNCGLIISNLRETDAQTYTFRFYTDRGDYTGEPGVSLSVTGLKVTVSDSGSGQMNLSCITTCTLSNNHSYIWYKKGQRVSDCTSASCSVAEVSGVDTYSCAVEGHDSLRSPPYSEEKTMLKLIIVGLIVFLAVTVIVSGALCMWTRKTSAANVHSSPAKSEHRQSALYLAGRVTPDAQDSIHYASVDFKRSHIQEGSLPPDTTDEEHVQYATVKKCTEVKRMFSMSRR